MTGALVSVIVPVHDGARYLPEALASLRAQTYEPIEVLVVDDASTDGSGALAAASGPVRVLRSDELLGPAAARNLGLDHATGEFVAFLDADDLMSPAAIAVETGHLLRTPACDLVMGRQEVRQEGGAGVPEWFPRDRLFQEPGGIPLSTAVARTEVLASVRFDPLLIVGEWRDWLLRVREAGYAIDVLDDVVLTRRLHEHNLSHRREQMREELMRSLQRKIARSREG